MTEQQFGEGPPETLTLDQAFDAMVEFVRAFWERSGKPDDELGYFVTIVGRSGPGMTMDPAHWDDWRTAVATARSETRRADV